MTTEQHAPRSSRLPLYVALGVVGVAVAVIAVWFVFLKSDAPDKLALEPSATTSGEIVDATSLDGTWKVTPGTGDDATVAGYRVKEEFVAGARKEEAAGRTNEVTGSVTVRGGKVTAVEIKVDVSTLASDESRRDNRIRTDGLQTDQFPEATFVLTKPVDLPELTEGAVVEVPATGSLTLHGVTKPLTIPLQVKATGATFQVQGSAPVVMADFGIDPPNIGGFVTVSDNGSFEFLVNLARN
ncbi:MAG: YceI family protein [Aquihabitans sp.]